MATVKIKLPSNAGQTLMPMEIVKTHIHAINDDEDDLIKEMIEASLYYVASMANWCFSVGAKPTEVTVFMDKDEFEYKLRGASDLSLVNGWYKNNTNGTWTPMEPADYSVNTETYPVKFRIKNSPSDIIDEQEAVYKFFLTGGPNITSLPPQFKMAVLLLVGHYYVNREAEYVGGITQELKEGVRRLVSSVKKY